jgi:hypothetical protein
MSKIVSFTGLAATFLVAYACDRWVQSLRMEATRTFVFAPYLWLAGAANLLLAIALLLLIWYVIFWADQSTLVSSMFVLIGLALTFASAIEMSAASTLPPLSIAEFFTPNSHVLYVAAFVAVIGIAGFVLPRRRSI